jgi:hypothetical protein
MVLKSDRVVMLGLADSPEDLGQPMSVQLDKGPLYISPPWIWSRR